MAVSSGVAIVAGQEERVSRERHCKLTATWSGLHSVVLDSECGSECGSTDSMTQFKPGSLRPDLTKINEGLSNWVAEVREIFGRRGRNETIGD